MITPEALSALSAKLAAATEGDGELDRDIALALGWTPPAIGLPYWHDEEGNHWSALDDWSTSIDSALGLVTRLLPEWHVEIYGASSQTAAVKIEPPLRKDGEAAWSPNNRPPPIAILTALVSALSQPGVQS